MKNLIPITDFIYQVGNNKNNINYETDLAKIYNYNIFLRQELKLEMFVPCDENGNVLEKPDFTDGSYDDNGFGDVDKYRYKENLKKYEEAKNNCLFEIYSFEEECDDFWYFAINELTLIGIDKVGTIEDIVKYNLRLTPFADMLLEAGI